MTDFTNDELVSAVLDGEATEEEAARVRADAALSARLAELRAARDAIAASVPLPKREQRDALIAGVITSPDAAAAVRPVDDLRDRRRRRLLRVASIAAALLAVVGLVGAIAALTGRNNSRKAGSTAVGTAPSSSAAASGLPAAAQPGPPPSDEAQKTAGALADLAELGSFQTPQALADAVKAQLTPRNLTQAAAPTSPPPDVACGSRRDVIYVARASLAGQPVVVIVSGSAGQQTIDVVDLNCTVVFTRPL
jgi:hypothetical protein